MSTPTIRPIQQWPGKPRTHRKPSPFRSSWTSTVELLEREVHMLRRFGATPPPLVVLQIAVTETDLRLDGWLRANAQPSHPGVILSISDSIDGPLEFACDAFDHWRDNVRAIALGMSDLRRLSRYGIGQGHEQYRGFRAIGAESTAMTAMSREDAAALLIEFSGPMGAGYEPADVIGDRAMLDIVWKLASRLHHPDTGGDEDTTKKINVARDILLKA